LEENVKINRCEENVRINRMALGEYCGKGEIWVPTREGAGPTFASFRRQDWGRHIKVLCDVVTLDCYVSLMGLTKIDFVKCDVEGAELLVLQGARKTLESGIRPIWMLEVVPGLMKRFGFSPQNLATFLSSFEYKLCVLDSRGSPQQIEDVTQVEQSGGDNLVALPDEWG
jgi:FkbM family methyltransferase